MPKIPTIPPYRPLVGKSRSILTIVNINSAIRGHSYSKKNTIVELAIGERYIPNSSP